MAQNWASPPRLTQYYPNVAADLPSLHAADIALGRCTNKPQALTLRILDQLAIALLFSAVIGADAVAACKTDPGHLFAVTNKMGLQPGTSSYVGDIGIVQAAALAAEVPFFVVPELPPEIRALTEAMIGSLLVAKNEENRHVETHGTLTRGSRVRRVRTWSGGGFSQRMGWRMRR